MYTVVIEWLDDGMRRTYECETEEDALNLQKRFEDRYGKENIWSTIRFGAVMHGSYYLGAF